LPGNGRLTARPFTQELKLTPSLKHGSVLEPAAEQHQFTDQGEQLWVAEMIKKVSGCQKTPTEEESGTQRTRAEIALKSTKRFRTGRFHGAT
jgi:hypothetical protein